MTTKATRDYTPEDHKRAFDIFYEKRSFNAVAETMNLAYTTPFRWAESDYRCKHHCPWHNWQQLCAERDKAINARLGLLEKGNLNPVAHHAAMVQAAATATSTPRKDLRTEEARAEMEQTATEKRQYAVDELVRSDLERLVHWEILYAKAFYDATGVALHYDQLVDPDTGTHIAEKELFRMGLHTTNLNAAIQAMQACQTEINRIKASLTEDFVRQKKGRKYTAGAVVDSPSLGIGELRKLREFLSNTPGEKVQMLLMQVERSASAPTS